MIRPKLEVPETVFDGLGVGVGVMLQEASVQPVIASVFEHNPSKQQFDGGFTV